MASASPSGSSTSLLNKGVLSSRIDREASLIASLNQQEADWEVRRADNQQGLQAKFTGMETALSQLALNSGRLEPTT